MEKKMSMCQFAEFSVAVLRSLPREMDATVAQGWIEDQAFLAKVLREALTNFVPITWRGEWTRFYREVFGLHVDLSGVAIPDEKPGFGWVVMVADGLTLNRVWEKCEEKFPSCFFLLGDDLDKVMSRNDRTAELAYARRFRDRVEADEELKNVSANQLAERHIRSTTLLERLLLELWYFWKTGRHLDIQNITLCAGSRCSLGGIPFVYCYDGELGVDCCGPGDHYDRLRARAAV